jgi:hypothetical protein
MFRVSPAAWRRALAATALTFFAAACADQPTTVSPVPAPEGTEAPTALSCTVTVATGALDCRVPAAEGSGASRAIYGGQNTLVRLASSNAHMDGPVFEIDVTVTNLLASQAIGTVDGVTPHANGVRVFFSSGPEVTGGTGEVTVANADGEAFITAPAQPYFQWNGILASGATSAVKPWRFAMDPGVATFRFVVLISTEAQANLVISELMANPAGALQDSVGEYVEVYNAGALPVNLRGFYVRDNGSAADTIKSDVVVAAGDYAVLARSADPAKNGGIAADYAYTVRIGTTSTNLRDRGQERRRPRAAEPVGRQHAGGRRRLGRRHERVRRRQQQQGHAGRGQRRRGRQHARGARGHGERDAHEHHAGPRRDAAVRGLRA